MLHILRFELILYKGRANTSCSLRFSKLEYVNTSLAAPGALAHRLQRRTACNTSPPTLSKMADGVPK